MYKYFNAASGAVLAGPKNLLDNLFHIRRMFGGGLSHVWPFAAVANHYFDDFSGRYAAAVAVSEKVIAGLQQDTNLRVSRIPNGTNVFTLHCDKTNPGHVQERLRMDGVVVPAPVNGTLLISVNETWNRATPSDILERFRTAAKPA